MTLRYIEQSLNLGLDLPEDVDHDPLKPHPEIPTPIELVVRLTHKDRQRRTEALIELAHQKYDQAIEEHVGRRNIAAVCLLVSGGNDSYTVAHLFRDRATHFVHANTHTGIEATRQHVRDTAKAWGIPLLEVHPKPGQGYRDLVLGNVYARSKTTGLLEQSWPGGFPGPAAHQVMYTRLKERGLARIPHLLGISRSRNDRAVFIAGRRRPESEIRKDVPYADPRGTTLWVSPIAVWHKADLRTYRLMVGDTPVNPVAQTLGMSGECGCLANAKPGERERWIEAFPDDPFIKEMLELEELIKDRDDIDPVRKIWGNGVLHDTEERAPGGLMCGKDCGPDPLLDLMDPLFNLETTEWAA